MNLKNLIVLLLVVVVGVIAVRQLPPQLGLAQESPQANTWVSHDIPFKVPCPSDHRAACSPPPNFQKYLPDGSPNLEYIVEDSVLTIFQEDTPIAAYEYKGCTMAFIEDFKNKRYQRGRPVTGPQEYGYDLDFKSEFEKHKITSPNIKWIEPQVVPCQ